MTEQLLRAARTTLSGIDTYHALRAACEAAGAPLERTGLLVLLAQVWLETGSGLSSYGYNLAGIKYGKGRGFDYYAVQTHEIIGGKDTLVVANFRSYDSLEAAAGDYVHLLRTRFVLAWPAVEAADVGDFATKLHQAGYFTALAATYSAGLRARYAQVLRLVPEDTMPELPVANVVHPPIEEGVTDPSDLPEPEDA